jgi:hypothetical protein
MVFHFEDLDCDAVVSFGRLLGELFWGGVDPVVVWCAGVFALVEGFYGGGLPEVGVFADDLGGWGCGLWGVSTRDGFEMRRCTGFCSGG